MQECVCVLQVLGPGRLRAAVSAGPHVVLRSLLYKRGLPCDGVPLHHIQHLSRNVYLHLPLPPSEKSTCFLLVCPAESDCSFKVKICLKILKSAYVEPPGRFCSRRSAKSTASVSATRTAAAGCRRRARTVLWRPPPHGPAPAILLVLR